jgi:hypothetical protein
MIDQETSNQIQDEEPKDSVSSLKSSGVLFPGLRPFRFEESHLFFGQDSSCEKVISKLMANKFVCLLGGAGVGKTSLIHCDLKPWLYSGLISDNKNEWHIFDTQPGLDPVKNLAKAVCLEVKSFFDETRRIQEQISYSVLQRGKTGITELFDQLGFSVDKNYLFFIDQFEDLFRLRYKVDDVDFFEESLEFVNLLIEGLKSSKYKIHIIVSIRSDFTDDCVMFPVLAEMINQSNVLIPRMSRDQIKQVVLGPLQTANIKIDKTCLAQILNDATIAEDVLPRLQYAMKRTLESWSSLNSPDKPISLKEYESVGGIQGSISAHANHVFDELTEEDKNTCELIFKSLTERGAENKGLGRACTIKELAGIAKVGDADVIRIFTLFSQPDMGFLTSDAMDMQPETAIQLSHVSIMRAWDKLRKWVDDEAISGQMYKQLSQSSASYQIGRAGLLRPPDLQFAINWREKQRPTLAWAKRYSPAFERTMVYLRTSLEAFEAEETLKKVQAKKAITKIRSLSVVLGTTAALAILVTIYAQVLRRNAETQKRLALEQKIEADSKSNKAEKISKEALEDKLQAEIAANEAEKKKLIALQENNLLSQQKSFAEVTAQEAVKKTSETEKNLVEMSHQKQQIEQSALQASIQKTEAEKEKEETFKKRLLTMAQTIAVKSNQLSNNRPLKALLALHAYEFNKKNGGFDIHPDIYNALSSALIDNGINHRRGLKGHSASVKALCLNPRTNTLYSTGSDGRILSWNLSENDLTSHVLLSGGQGNLSLAISQNGRWLAIGTENGTIQILDLSNPGTKPVQLKGHQGVVYAVAFSKDGQQLFSSGADKKILLWDISSSSSSVVYNESNTVRALGLSPDGKFLAGGADDGRVLIWDIKNNQVVSFAGEDNNPIYAISFNYSGTSIATGDSKGNVKLWNPYSRKLIKNLKNHNARVVDIKFSSNSDFMVSSSYDGTAYIFDTRYLNNPPIVIREPSTWILSVELSADNKRLMMATNKPDFIITVPSQTKIMAEQLCSKMSRGLTTDEWNTYIGSDLKYEKPCE